MRSCKLTTVALLLITLAGCKCNNKQEAQQEEKAIELDSTQTALSIIQEDSTMVFDDRNSAWRNENFTQRGFNWDGFKLQSFWAEENFERKDANLTPDFLKHYAPVLRWSPDSSYILDIGSYGGVVMQKADGNTTVEKGEPDTEVSLVFPKENKKTRVLFAGPSLHILNATWADSTQVAMLGTLDTSATGAKPDTPLWMIDVKDHFFRKYKWH